MLQYAIDFYGGQIPADHIDIWLRFYMRRNNLDVASFAAATGRSEKTILGVVNGESRPDSMILSAMGLEEVDGGYRGVK